MQRYAKTFAQPMHPDDIAPKSNKFTLDLMGLNLSEGQLARVRAEAVKAAMTATAGLLGGGRGRNVLQDFGTFSTFSTFSSFGSGVSSPNQQDDPGQQGDPVQQTIQQTLGEQMP